MNIIKLLGNRAQNEETLLRRAAAGDKEAFGDLYEKYFAQIYRYVYYRVGDRAEAEDVTANVFIKAWEGLPKLDTGPLNFRAWIYRIAHNLIIDRHRVSKVEISLDDFDGTDNTAPLPEKSQIENEETNRIRRLIQALEPEYQQVIICRFINDLSHSETAQIMNRSEVYVRVLQYRALKKLKSLLIEEAEKNGRPVSGYPGDLY